MASYFFSFLWGIIILLSLTGWGSVTRRCFFPKSQTDWGQKAAWGIALSILVGGVLNIAGLISRTTVLVYLGGGFLYRLFDIFSGRDTNRGLLREYIRDWRRDKAVMAGIFAIFFLALVQYGGWVSTQDFNNHDDFHAYFVFPKKMLQAGSMGPDPFSERRIISSLGGHAFLQTFVLSVLSEQNLNIIDPGLGVIIVIGLLLGHFKDKNTPKGAIVLILIFFLITPYPKANVTATVIPTVLFISLFRTLEWEALKGGGRFIANSSIIALITAAICSLKSSLIPACGVLLVTSYIFYITRAEIKREAVYEFFVAVILTGVFLLPWMISMYQSSGTLLYPLLGKGYHGTAYDTFLGYRERMTTERTISILTYHFSRPYVVLLVWLSFAALRLRSTRSGRRGAYISVSTGAILGTIIILIATGGAGSRYYFSFTFAAVLILLAAVLSDPETRKDGSMGIYAYAAMSLAFITIGYNWDSFIFQYVRFIGDVRKGVSNVSLISDKEAAQYSRMQLSVPAGETILERLSKPFLLDFRRNRIFLADYPGGASLPPGMPFFKGPEMLADYLISKSIRYAAYSYASEAGFRWKDYEDRLDSISSLITTETEHAFDFQNNLEQLGKTRKRIYDDGDIFVLDLLSYQNQVQGK